MLHQVVDILRVALRKIYFIAFRGVGKIWQIDIEFGEFKACLMAMIRSRGM